MVLTDTLPTACSHCQPEIPASTYSEDFFAGATSVCTEYQARFQYLPTEDLMKRKETPVMNEFWDDTSALAMVNLAERFHEEEAGPDRPGQAASNAYPLPGRAGEARVC